MRPVQYLVMILGMALLLTACGGAEAAAPAAAAPAPAAITLLTDPSPPTAGDVTLFFTLTDAAGQAVGGADFDVIADHIEMSGMTLHGKAADQGDGRYALVANFSMAGKWLLTLQARKDALNFKQDVELEVK
ncbi:MAG: FixH family protein [Chloroflexi bacterium]|nr:FixH family protein [Chloroflexota bacterium]